MRIAQIEQREHPGVARKHDDIGGSERKNRGGGEFFARTNDKLRMFVSSHKALQIRLGFFVTASDFCVAHRVIEGLQRISPAVQPEQVDQPLVTSRQLIEDPPVSAPHEREDVGWAVRYTVRS